MSNTTHARPVSFPALLVMATIVLGVGSPIAVAAESERATMSTEHALSSKQQSIAPISAAMAVGDIAGLDAALVLALRQRGEFAVLNRLGRDR